METQEVITNLIKFWKKENIMKALLDKIFPNQKYFDRKAWIVGNDNKLMIGGWKSGGVQLDRYYPYLKLAFEYNGRQHYDMIWNRVNLKVFLNIVSNDQRKQEMCRKVGVNLIVIKYNEKLTEQLILNKLKESEFDMEVLCQKSLEEE